MPRMHPQLSPMMQAPPPTGCTGKAPPPLPPVAPPEVVGDGAANTVEEGLFALLSDAPARSTPHPSAKATTAAPPHHAAAILALRFITRSIVIRLSRVRISHTAAAERFPDRRWRGEPRESVSLPSISMRTPPLSSPISIARTDQRRRRSQ
jgi:hypothetical protein